MDEKGKTIFKGFSFSNTTEGGKSLLDLIKKYSEFTDVTVGMEAKIGRASCRERVY